MSQNRSAIKSRLHSTKQSYFELLNTAENLLIDCKKFGTMPFSTMARIAFIASLLLKSLIKQQKINSKFYNTFMNSITTPLSEFQHDFEPSLSIPLLTPSYSLPISVQYSGFRQLAKFWKDL